MILETDHDYHMRRARTELDLAYQTECRAAMESHLRLSSLHMQRLMNLESAPQLASLQSPLHTSAQVFSLRLLQRDVEAHEVEAISG